MDLLTWVTSSGFWITLNEDRDIPTEPYYRVYLQRRSGCIAFQIATGYDLRTMIDVVKMFSEIVTTEFYDYLKDNIWTVK
jgi:hypothetical protein